MSLSDKYIPGVQFSILLLITNIYIGDHFTGYYNNVSSC